MTAGTGRRKATWLWWEEERGGESLGKRKADLGREAWLRVRKGTNFWKEVKERRGREVEREEADLVWRHLLHLPGLLGLSSREERAFTHPWFTLVIHSAPHVPAIALVPGVSSEQRETETCSMDLDPRGRSEAAGGHGHSPWARGVFRPSARPLLRNIRF